MDKLSTKEIIVIGFLVYFAFIGWTFLSTAKPALENQAEDLQIKREVHISNLIAQYNNDLNACFEEAEIQETITEDDCIKIMNESNLAELIKGWGYEDVLATLEKQE